MTARLRTFSPSLIAGSMLACLIGCSGGGKSPHGDLLDGGSDASTDDGGNPSDAALSMLTFEPNPPMLQVTGDESTLQLTALLDGMPLKTVTWSSDNSRLGYIDANGVFHSKGLVAGTTTITGRFNGHTGSVTLRVVSNVERSEDGVTPEQKTALDSTPPTANANFKWLYPYDKTVFPRGLPGPFMQFGDGAADATRITAKVGDFSYKGYFTTKNPASIQLPAEIWDALTNSSDGTQEVSLEVLKLVGSSVVGPATQTWRIAAGDLKGIIYYNSYNSPLAKNSGAVMRIRPGSDAEVLISTAFNKNDGGCTVCHSVSAHGNVLGAGVQWGDSGNPKDSATFDLMADGSAPVRVQDTEGRKYPFAGFTPDGSMLVNCGVPNDSTIRGLGGDYPSQLIDSKTGAVIAAPTLTSQVKYALTPVFSPDGKRLAFSSFDNDEKAKKLKVMDVDLTTQPPTFGAPVTVADFVGPTVSGGAPGVVGWPSFVPDAKGVLFHEGDRFDTGQYGAKPSYAELRLADITANKVNKLAALNGWINATDSYFPYGVDEESRRNYEPSVLPVPVGGYYWVIFTSRRAYGHTLAPGGTVPGTDNEWGTFDNNTEHPSLRKKLWVAAIDLDYTGKDDPSHPAFYLPGQELMAGNMRAFTALEPCKQEGDSCSSGAECCEGFCRQIDASGEFGEVQYTCVPPVAGCSYIDETCVSDADCCGYDTSGVTCINNRCAAPFVELQ
ncbi:MAG: hypothetical protein QM778_01445 [Myxococcales bacterium]